MGTPAKTQDVEIKRTDTVSQDQSWPGGVHETTSVEHSVAWHRSVRPASNSVPKQRDTGWRDCAKWSNEGRGVIKGGVTSFRTKRFSNGDTDVFTWRGGSFWSSYAPAGIPDISDSLRNQVTVRALNKVKNQDIHLGNYFAEGKATVNMVATRIRQIARSVRTFALSNPVEWAKVLRYHRGLDCRYWHLIPRTWLEIVYGWNPLLSDIRGGLLQLQKEGKAHGQVVNVSASKVEYEHSDRKVFAAAGPSNVTVRQKTKHFVKVSLWYKLTNGDQALRSQLGLLNPAEIVWEGVPFSFVLDWALPIGPWLSALSANAGWSFLGGSRSELSRCAEEVTTVDMFKGGSPGVFTVEETGPLSIADKGSWRFKRVCLGDSPVPGLYVKNPISPIHVMNALSLLSLALFGKGR